LCHEDETIEVGGNELVKVFDGVVREGLDGMDTRIIDNMID
jgi:hypothetical protein